MGVLHLRRWMYIWLRISPGKERKVCGEVVVVVVVLLPVDVEVMMPKSCEMLLLCIYVCKGC